MKLSTAASIVIFPLLLMLGWIGQLSFVAGSGAIVRFHVTGADPRDLLAGHYLRYRIDYSTPICAGQYEGNEMCVCVSEKSDGYAKADLAAACGGVEMRGCKTFIRGRCEHGTFSAGIERFYFPEEYSRSLSLVPQNAWIEVRVAPSGDALVTGMFVDGTPIVEWAETNAH